MSPEIARAEQADAHCQVGFQTSIGHGSTLAFRAAFDPNACSYSRTVKEAPISHAADAISVLVGEMQNTA